MKANKITLFYFGSASSTIYRAKTVTINQLKKWREQRNKNIKDIAFILAGEHKDIESYNLTSYLQENNLQKMSIYQF